MTQANPERVRPRWTVLVVEDDPDLGKLLERYFSYQGLTVLLETDGLSALELFKTGHSAPDLLLTDVHIPGLDGYELLREVRRVCPHTPVIFLTGDDDPVEVKAGDVTPNVCLRKPMRLADLGEAVGTFLELQNAALGGVA
jgi:two-component system OmpR family response regulator